MSDFINKYRIQERIMILSLLNERKITCDLFDIVFHFEEFSYDY